MPGKQISAEAAADLIGSGQTIAVSGNVSMVVPEAVLRALGERYRRSGEPRDLTLFSPTRSGWVAEPQTGYEHLAQPGLVRRVLTSTFSHRDSPLWTAMALRGELEAYCFPMGTMFRLVREIAAGSPGLLTRVGLNTFADPAAGEMRVSGALPTQDLIERIEIGGEPCLLYRTFPLHVALIRGTIADVDGNISMAGEPASLGVRHLAMAARASGGVVVAQVKHVTERGTIHPRMVEVPGILVDAVVVDPDSIQTQMGYEPAITGEVRTPEPPVAPLPFDIQKIIIRRAARELERGDVVNLGVGMGSKLPALALEEGFLEDVTFSVEHGPVGGLPAVGTPKSTGAFGAHYNPDVILDSLDVFDFYHGGGLDTTFLGFAQIDAEGSVNVGFFSGNLRGPGGFVDITHRTRKVVFCGTLTAGGLEVEITPPADAGPALRVVREGRNRKFLRRVEQVNLHGPSAVQKGQRVVVVTERAVFELTPVGLELVEIAPGLRPEADVAPHLDFELRVSPALREMDPEIFRESPGRFRPRPPESGVRRGGVRALVEQASRY